MNTFRVQTDPVSGQRRMVVLRRGADLKNDPLLNKGTCFTKEERRELGLAGLLPPAVSTVAEQEFRAYENYLREQTDVDRYLFLSALHDRNETLFYRVLCDHLEEMVPVVYTPTVGKACEQYSHLYRRPRGVYVTPNDRGHIRQILENAPGQDIRVIVVTDNEAILGLGDLGVGGMGIPIGKLALYTAGAGIHPAATLPIDLDVGTDNDRLLRDPSYLGLRQPRVRGAEYSALIEELVEAVIAVFPQALLQWEDFSNENAFRILEQYRDRLLSFNDDIQGTSAVVLAAIHGALHQAGRHLPEERVVLHGCGAAGGGSGLAIREAMRSFGVPDSELGQRVLCLDSRGLVLADRPGLPPHKRAVAADPTVVDGWDGGSNGRFELLDVVRNFKPTILIGASGRPGAFNEELVREMHRHCVRPVIFPLSNPTAMTEATPAEVIRWTDGAAILATGSPFPPAEFGGEVHEIAQANNVLVFPGLGLGALAARATRLPDTAFLAAADAVYRAHEPSTHPGSTLLPSISHLREVSRMVAMAVARSLVASGDAPPASNEELADQVDALMWQPEYLPYAAEEKRKVAAAVGE